MARGRYAAMAIAFFAGFLAIGYLVRLDGEPALFVGWEQAMVNHSTLIAWWLTWLCFVYVLVPLCVVLSIVAWRVPSWRARILLSVVSALVSWQAADLAQRLFGRPRRLDWVVRHETAFSYPSSHAALAVGFYALWAVMLASPAVPKPVRRVVPPLLGLLAAAICWSRLALGAHYLTDLVGGALLGAAVASAALAVAPIKLRAPDRGADVG